MCVSSCDSPSSAWCPTTASTQSLTWAPVQQVTCDGCSVRSEARGPRWERGKQTVHPGWAPPGSRRRTASRRPGRRAWTRRSCRARAARAQPGSACPPAHLLGEVCRSWRRWSGWHRPTGGRGGESSPQCSPPHTWTGSGWPLRRTRWSRLCT